MKWLDRWLGRKDPRDEAVRAAKMVAATSIDTVFDKARSGAHPTDAELDACGAACSVLWKALAARHGTESNVAMPEPDRSDYYLLVSKLAAIGHPHHDAWPIRSDLRTHVLEELRRRQAAAADPWVDVCTIPGTLAWGDDRTAVAIHERLAHDPYLSRLVARWADAMRIEYPAINDVGAAARFVAAIRPHEPWNATSTSVADERRWILHASFFPSLAIDPRTALGDARPASVVRKGLANAWNVKDEASASEILAWLFGAGHSAVLSRDLETGTAASAARASFIATNRAALERHRIRAWDLGRLVQVARGAYASGYLDEATTWSWLDRVGDELRATYDSWESYAADYAIGSGYFDPTQRDDNHAATARWLATDPSSPWRNLRFGGGRD